MLMDANITQKNRFANRFFFTVVTLSTGVAFKHEGSDAARLGTRGRLGCPLEGSVYRISAIRRWQDIESVLRSGGGQHRHESRRR
ncbi:hypothetical protein EMEDMD4_270212 [Sinorhizobium medicae]|uniref:Uncharacterized protein n=1 Tax=Sinorhizobium medicae TaxID=110321 RepID=A0A508WVL0_9HYPH|nr:hypothetical protein EMEDMD4_270212 [Sinorhizobium medicae]